MSESHYWPGEPGEYIVSVRETYIAFFILENGLWHSKYHPELKHTTEQLKEMGYLGVRREQTAESCVDDTSDKYAEAELHAAAFSWRHAIEHGIEVTVDGQLIGKAKYWEDSGDSDVGLPASGGWELQGNEYRELCEKANNVEATAAIAAQALAELRLCRKPFHTERWAYEWGPRLCALLGAE